jgi:hypothetical protein
LPVSFNSGPALLPASFVEKYSWSHVALSGNGNLSSFLPQNFASDMSGIEHWLKRRAAIAGRVTALCHEAYRLFRGKGAMAETKSVSITLADTKLNSRLRSANKMVMKGRAVMQPARSRTHVHNSGV